MLAGNQLTIEFDGHAIESHAQAIDQSTQVLDPIELPFLAVDG
jgi:hypothetical protein